MKKLLYIFKIIRRVNFNNMFEAANKVNKKINRNKLLIIIDIVWCALRYGSGYNDYLHFGFYQLNSKQRKTYLTRSSNNKLVAMLNKKEKVHLLDNKNEFNSLYNEYLKREWFYIDNNENDFKKWIKNKDVVIVKPINDSGGKGIERICIKDYKSITALYKYLNNKKLYLIEELIVQHPKLADIYPESVNTIRIITISNGNEVEFLKAFLRVGNGTFVDNTCSGGFVIPVDLKTGKTTYPGIGLNEEAYKKHPITNKEFVGIQIPMWNKTIEMIKNACKVNQDIKYTGWDVAITKSGPCLVEGNPYPGYYYQFPVHLPKKIGYLPRVKRILKKLDLDENII